MHNKIISSSSSSSLSSKSSLKSSLNTQKSNCNILCHSSSSSSSSSHSSSSHCSSSQSYYSSSNNNNDITSQRKFNTINNIDKSNNLCYSSSSPHNSSPNSSHSSTPSSLSSSSPSLPSTSLTTTKSTTTASKSSSSFVPISKSNSIAKNFPLNSSVDNKKNGKFIAKNRYVYDEKYDTPRNWPIWPSNIYITSSTHLNSNSIFLPQSDTIYSSDTNDDSLTCASNDINDSNEDEPHFKRVRLDSQISMVSNSQSISEPGDYDIDEIDCEILSCFFSFTEDELLSSDLLF